MNEIAYTAPRTVADAVSALKEANGNGKLLAGGTDILVQLREGARKADVLVDLKKIPEMTEIRQLPSGGWQIGAATPCHRIESTKAFAEAYPGIIDAVHVIGGWQIKGRASLGGNLCTSSPAADSIPSLIAHSVIAKIVGPNGNRDVPIADFCTGPGKNVLQPAELVVAFEVPALPPSSSGCYLRFIPRSEMDIAVVGCGTTLTVSGDRITHARIALGAVAPKPLLAEEAAKSLIGQPATLESFTKAGELARKIATPISDMRGPAEYRTHLVGVLVQRSLATSLRRIQGEHVNVLQDKLF